MIHSYSQRQQASSAASVPFQPHVTVVGGIACPSVSFVRNYLIPQLIDKFKQHNENGKEKQQQHQQQGQVDKNQDNDTPQTTTENSSRNTTKCSVTTSTITCKFNPTPVYQHQPWNQACVLVMDEKHNNNVEFMHLVEMCRDVVASALANDDDDDDDYKQTTIVTETTKDITSSCKRLLFPPPLCQPHLSLYYGTADGAPSPSTVLQDLVSNNNMERSQQEQQQQEDIGDVFSFEANQVAVWMTEPASVAGVALWKELCVIDL